jgi:hypothetical protein
MRSILRHPLALMHASLAVHQLVNRALHCLGVNLEPSAFETIQSD